MHDNSERIRKLDQLYSKYGKEEFFSALKQIGPRNRDIFNKYFGLTKDGFFSVKEISQAYNMTEINVYKLLNKELERMEKWLNNPEISMELIKENKSIKLMRVFKKYGKEKVLKEINDLDKAEKRLMCFYYQLNIGDLKCDEIQEFDNVDKKSVYLRVKRVWDDMEYKMENKGNIRKGRRNSKLERLYQLCGEERLKYFVSHLSSNNKRIMELYLGIGEEYPKTPLEISEMTGLKTGSVNTIIWANTKKLEQIYKNPDLMSGKIHAERVNQLNELYKKYGKDEFDEVVKSLNEIEKNMILSYYGINCKKTMSVVDIAAKYNVAEKEAISIVRKTNYYIEKVLKMRSDFNVKLRREYLTMFSKYDREEVLLAVKLLEEKEREILMNFLGLERVRKGADEIAKECNMTIKEVVKSLEKSYKEIMSIMDDTPFEIRELMCTYGKRNVRRALKDLSEKHMKTVEDYQNGEDNYDDFSEVIRRMTKKLDKQNNINR